MGSLVVAALFVIRAPALSADTVRLKNGNTFEGRIIRADEQSILILVDGQKLLMDRQDVAALTYAPIPTPRKLPPFDMSTLAEPFREGRLGHEFLMAIRQRLSASQQVTRNLREAWVAVHYENQEVVSAAIRNAAHHWLPLRNGEFEPITLLAQLLVLLGLRILTLWLGLAIVRQEQDFVRIAEFMVPAYGLMVLLVSFWAVHSTLSVMVVSTLSCVLGATLLFMWMFSVSPWKALVALVLVLGMNILIEYSLLHASLIRLGFFGSSAHFG